MTLEESLKARIAELDGKIAAREGQSGYTANVAALTAARAELQRALDAADG